MMDCEGVQLQQQLTILRISMHPNAKYSLLNSWSKYINVLNGDAGWEPPKIVSDNRCECELPEFKYTVIQSLGH